jgi:hypothetical protein
MGGESGGAEQTIARVGRLASEKFPLYVRWVLTVLTQSIREMPSEGGVRARCP